VSHMVTINWLTYNNLQVLTNYIGGCELPTKCIAIVLDNDSNDNGNVSKSFIALLRSCAKLTTFPVSACWLVVLVLLVYFNLTNMLWQR
jgi:hypothetical protein